jgi:hypothetical protein
MQGAAAAEWRQVWQQHPPKVKATKYQEHSEVVAAEATLPWATRAMSMPAVQRQSARCRRGEWRRELGVLRLPAPGAAGSGLTGEAHSPQACAASMETACLLTSRPQMFRGRCGRSTCLRRQRRRRRRQPVRRGGLCCRGFAVGCAPVPWYIPWQTKHSRQHTHLLYSRLAVARMASRSCAEMAAGPPSSRHSPCSPMAPAPGKGDQGRPPQSPPRAEAPVKPLAQP